MEDLALYRVHFDMEAVGWAAVFHVKSSSCCASGASPKYCKKFSPASLDWVGMRDSDRKSRQTTYLLRCNTRIWVVAHRAGLGVGMHSTGCSQRGTWPQGLLEDAGCAP